MLPDKPWRPELVLRLMAGLFASMLLGVIIVDGYSGGAEAARNNPDFFIFLVGVFSFHGVGLVLGLTSHDSGGLFSWRSWLEC